MARIPEAEVERLKREISVQRLAEARGIKLTRQGADLVGKCPFHDDRTPSLVITPAKNLWHCLGACNMGGDGHRLGDEGRWRELPPCGRVAASRPFSLSRRTDPAGQARAQCASCRRRLTAEAETANCCRRSWAITTRREAVAGGATVSGRRAA